MVLLHRMIRKALMPSGFLVAMEQAYVCPCCSCCIVHRTNMLHTTITRSPLGNQPDQNRPVDCTRHTPDNAAHPCSQGVTVGLRAESPLPAASGLGSCKRAAGRWTESWMRAVCSWMEELCSWRPYSGGCGRAAQNLIALALKHRCAAGVCTAGLGTTLHASGMVSRPSVMSLHIDRA